MGVVSLNLTQLTPKSAVLCEMTRILTATAYLLSLCTDISIQSPQPSSKSSQPENKRRYQYVQSESSYVSNYSPCGGRLRCVSPAPVPYSRARRTAVRCQSASVRCLLIYETLKDMASGRKTVAGDDTSQRQYTAPKGCGVGSRGTAMRLSCYARTTRADFRRSMLIVRGGWVYMATSADWPTYS